MGEAISLQASMTLEYWKELEEIGVLAAMKASFLALVNDL